MQRARYYIIAAASRLTDHVIRPLVSDDMQSIEIETGIETSIETSHAALPTPNEIQISRGLIVSTLLSATF
jgi:hypothetical protein